MRLLTLIALIFLYPVIIDGRLVSLVIKYYNLAIDNPGKTVLVIFSFSLCLALGSKLGDLLVRFIK